MTICLTKTGQILDNDYMILEECSKIYVSEIIFMISGMIFIIWWANNWPNFNNSLELSLHWQSRVKWASKRNLKHICYFSSPSSKLVILYVRSGHKSLKRMLYTDCRLNSEWFFTLSPIRVMCFTWLYSEYVILSRIMFFWRNEEMFTSHLL